MGIDDKSMAPAVSEYYKSLVARNELTRSDVSIFPSYTRLKIEYFVVCRQRYYKEGVKQRRQFIKEIKVHESLQSRALDGVRVHREFCNPVLVPPAASEIIKLTPKEIMRLEKILVTKY
ncbi:hypothetical protein PPYR_08096 [Photinus pyralis]|uniref:Uncharacterized protein n=1 Tax=Photinus pyralis TaxID=7054 RepID=A0A5N4AID1_PHOPY|nr:uncharacterized protein LOC116171655 [Photinus pyralis]KAB0797102.1 hypothetical protein PPYR_08096 [Photinus pyralis]